MFIREMKSTDLDLVVRFEKEYRILDKEIKMPFNEKEYRKRFVMKKIEDY